LPLQDPQAASEELTRCVKELGFGGALVNGSSQIGEADSEVFYDLPQYRPFWATVQELDVPFYLHPRALLASRQQAYEGPPVVFWSSLGIRGRNFDSRAASDWGRGQGLFRRL
jgi:2,3-dihydroxybenzoate decarboxylase